MKRTLQKKKKKRLRKHGFLSRQRNNSEINQGRRQKGRWQIAPVNSRKAN